MITFGERLGIRRRGESRHFDLFTQQGRQALGIPSALEKTEIAAWFHARAPERLNREIVGVAADAADGDLLPLNILRPLDISPRKDALRHDVFHAAYKDQVGGSLDIGADVTHPTGQGHLRIAAQHRRGHHS